MHADVSAWLDSLPAAVARHREVMRRLVLEAEADHRIRAVLVGCSLGRGAADELSDIDAGVIVADEAWPSFLDEVAPLVRRLGDVVDLYHHRLAEIPHVAHRRTFVQYATGVQLDLVVQPASAQSRPGRAPDVVVLHDPDGRLEPVVEPVGSRTTAADARGWAMEGWEFLTLVAKYLRRGSPWEAHARLGDARDRVWRLWAAAQGVPDARYGLSAVLDTPAVGIPPGVEATVAGLDPAAIARSARAVAALLEDGWRRATAAAEGTAAPLPPLAAWASRRLE